MRYMCVQLVCMVSLSNFGICHVTMVSEYFIDNRVMDSLSGFNSCCCHIFNLATSKYKKLLCSLVLPS